MSGNKNKQMAMFGVIILVVVACAIIEIRQDVKENAARGILDVLNLALDKVHR
jgi:hypothetical protein